MKAAQTGDDDDAGTVQRLSGAKTHTLARYPEPLSPERSAARASVPCITPREIADFVEGLEGRVVIEGAGGLLVNFGGGHDRRRRGAAATRRWSSPCAPASARSTTPRSRSRRSTGAACNCLGLVIGSWPADPDLASRCNLDDLATHRARSWQASRRPGPQTGDPRMILDIARDQVLEQGIGLNEAQTLEVLQLPDELVDDALELAHEVRMRHCGPEVEVEGIVSIKTGGCPEDCHFCSQSGRFETPVRAVRLDIPSLVEAARETAATGATEFCIVAAVRGPDERLMAQVREGVKAITDNVEINVACSLGILTREQGEELRDLGVHRYNHNLETARSHFGNVVTTHTWEERWETLQLVREMGMEVCCGGIIGMGETLEQRAELAAQFAALDPDEVPLNFLDPRPGTPFAELEPVPALDALRTIAAFRLALPRTILRFAGGRELTLGDLGARQGMVGGINAVIVGNYLTTLGRDPQEDLDLLAELSMPVKELSKTL